MLIINCERNDETSLQLINSYIYLISREFKLLENLLILVFYHVLSQKTVA